MFIPPKTIYIKENESYTELSAAEYMYLCKSIPNYKDSHYFIPVQNYLLEVTFEEYQDFYREAEHAKYLSKQQQKKEIIYLSELGPDFVICDSAENLQDFVERHILLEKVRYSLSMLSDEDRQFITQYYTIGKGARNALAKKHHIHPSNVTRRIQRILKEIRSYMNL